MKGRLIFDGGGNWNTTYIFLSQKPGIRHFSKGEVADIDYPAGSEEAVQLRALIQRGACRFMGDETPPKPAA